MGTGLNPDFYLPGTQFASTGGCFYYAPAPTPVPSGISPDCQYGGPTAPPKPTPKPTVSPGPTPGPTYPPVPTQPPN